MALSKFRQLVKEAAKYGTRVHVVNRVPGAAGHWDPWPNIIRIQKRFSNKIKLYLLAHEIGHVASGKYENYLDQALNQERHADNYSEMLAKKFGFYSRDFKSYIARRRKMVESKEYKDYLLWYGYIRRK